MPLDQGAAARGGGGEGGAAGEGAAEGPGGRAEGGGPGGSVAEGSVSGETEPGGGSGDGAAKREDWQKGQEQQQQQQLVVQTVCARALQQRWGRSPYWQDRGRDGGAGEEGQGPRAGHRAWFLGSAVHASVTEHVARLNVGLLEPWEPGAGGVPEGAAGAGRAEGREGQDGQGGGDHRTAWECPFGAVGCGVELLH